MSGKHFATVSVAMLGAFVVSTPVIAFEQQPVPSPNLPAPVIEPAQPGAKLDEQKKKEPAVVEQKKGFKIPGIGKVEIPKLNFGLDLMYGNEKADETDLGFSDSPEQDDVTIMGKVKRRF